ncbi:transposase InsO family protein, partial [Novosphingobium sp. SG751A]|nr:transposase InsO family protein [Novosphingobium sp. SG751A]
MNNVFIERLWRSVKYECVYLHAFETGSELRAGLARWFTYYNPASLHPPVYVAEGNRLCWSGCDPVGYFG